MPGEPVLETPGDPSQYRLARAYAPPWVADA